MCATCSSQTGRISVAMRRTLIFVKLCVFHFKMIPNGSLLPVLCSKLLLKFCNTEANFSLNSNPQFFLLERVLLGICFENVLKVSFKQNADILVIRWVQDIVLL